MLLRRPMWPLLVAPLLLAGLCGGVPLVLPSSGGLKRSLSAARQVAPSQGILGELQQLFREAAAGQQTAEYGAARDDLEQIVAGLDQLAAVVPQGQDSAAGDTTTASTTTERPADVPIIDPGQPSAPHATAARPSGSGRPQQMGKSGRMLMPQNIH